MNNWRSLITLLFVWNVTKSHDTVVYRSSSGGGGLDMFCEDIEIYSLVTRVGIIFLLTTRLVLVEQEVKRSQKVSNLLPFWPQSSRRFDNVIRYIG